MTVIGFDAIERPALRLPTGETWVLLAPTDDVHALAVELDRAGLDVRIVPYGLYVSATVAGAEVGQTRTRRT